MRPVLEKNQERRILTGMIIDTAFAGRMATIYRDDLFTTPYIRRLAKSVMHYFREHGQAPKKNIEGLFLRIAGTLRDDEDQDLMEALLQDISEEAEGLNTQYLAEEAEEHFNAARLKMLAGDIQAAAESGDVRAAMNQVLSYNKIDMTSSGGIFVFQNEAAWKAAFEESQEPLFHLPGAAGKFLNRYWVRDSFVAFQGGEKSGKSFILAEIAIRALRARRKVAMFEVGDQSQGQLLIRMGSRLSGVPIWKTDCGRYTRPIKFEQEQGDGGDYDSYNIVTGSGEIEEPLNFSRAWQEVRAFQKRSRCSEKGFALSCFPNDTCSLADIRAQLDVWEVQDGFIPDVIVVDYADIMVPENSRLEGRDGINSVWKGLRRLSQERHCLLATATQASRAAYNSPVQDASMLSEDKRKFAHVTGMFGINRIARKDADFKGDITRLNFIGGRWGVEGGRQSVLWLQDLARGAVLIDSIFE